MNSHIKKLALNVAIAGALASLPMSAVATNGILAYGNGMVAHGVGGAGVANPGEGMAAVDNPALAALVGGGWSIQASGFFPNAAANVGNGYVESDADSFLIPGGHWFGEINDTTVAGLTISAMGGMATDYSAQLMGASTGMELSGVIIAPTIATRVSDKVALGGAILFGYEELETHGPGMPPLPGNQEDDATGFGFELGMQIQATPSTSIGIDYQSKIDMDDMEAFSNTIFAMSSDKQLTLPPIWTIGITQGIGEKWKISADISDVPWSKVGVIDQVFGWEDQTVYKIGAEYQVKEDLALRFGYNYGKSPIPDSAVQQNILAPAITEQHYTIGFTKEFAAGKLHGYYAHIRENEQFQENPVGLPSIKMDQNAFGLGWEVQF